MVAVGPTANLGPHDVTPAVVFAAADVQRDVGPLELQQPLLPVGMQHSRVRFRVSKAVRQVKVSPKVGACVDSGLR